MLPFTSSKPGKRAALSDPCASEGEGGTSEEQLAFAESSPGKEVARASMGEGRVCPLTPGQVPATPMGLVRSAPADWPESGLDSPGTGVWMGPLLPPQATLFRSSPAFLPPPEKPLLWPNSSAQGPLSLAAPQCSEANIAVALPLERSCSMAGFGFPCKYVCADTRGHAHVLTDMHHSPFDLDYSRLQNISALLSFWGGWKVASWPGGVMLNNGYYMAFHDSLAIPSGGTLAAGCLQKEHFQAPNGSSGQPEFNPRLYRGTGSPRDIRSIWRQGADWLFDLTHTAILKSILQRLQSTSQPLYCTPIFLALMQPQ